MVTCMQCDTEYECIGSHWTKSSSCSHPEISDRVWNTIEGMLLGDGWINGHNDTTPFFGVKMINREFLQWLDTELGRLSTGVRLHTSAEESARQVKKWTGEWCDTSNAYMVRSRRHPDLEALWSWYDGDKKTFPDPINTSPRSLKMWYVSDGHLGNTSPKITSVTNSESLDRIAAQIQDETPIEYATTTEKDVGRLLVFPYSGTEDFFEYIGDPPPGFGRKWNQNC